MTLSNESLRFCSYRSRFLPLIAVLIANPAFAVSVIPGDSNILLAGTTSAANPNLGGVVQADSARAFEILNNLGDVVLRGTLQDRVFQSANTGTFVFAPRLRDLDGTAWITGMTITGYDGYTTDIDFRTDGLGNVGPNSVSRTADGEDLFFSHGINLIVPPDTGRFLSILTDATQYAPIGSATIYAQNDFGADVFSATIDGINVPVPEPNGVGVLSLVLVLTAFLFRKGLAHA